MAGLSSRFAKAGYKVPKYMLDIDGNSVFYHAVSSFKRYFDSCKFLFIYRDIKNTKSFIKTECENMGLKSYDMVELGFETQGQAHTVELGLEKSNLNLNDSILIFNIDTFRPDFALPNSFDISKIDGYLEVFEGEGDNWSFVMPKGIDDVAKTTEKDRISSDIEKSLGELTKAKNKCKMLESKYRDVCGKIEELTGDPNNNDFER